MRAGLKRLRQRTAAFRLNMRNAALHGAYMGLLDTARVFVEYEELLSEIASALARLAMLEEVKEKTS